MTPGDGDGIVLLGSGDRDFGAGLFVESGQGGLVAGVEGINLVAHDESVLRSFADAGAGAGGVIAGLHVLGAAHGVADFSGEGFCVSRECGGNGQA